MNKAICAVVTCDAPAVRREWCDKHHRRWKKTGTPYGRFAKYEDPALIVDYGEKTCVTAGCVRRAVARGLCGKCWQRAKRNGEEMPPTFRQFYSEGQLCAVDDCPRPVRARGWCKGHHRLWKKWGTPEGYGARSGAKNPAWVGDHIGYQGMHDRVRRHYGDPGDFWCVDECGDQAEDWAYDHLDPCEHIQEVKTRYRSGAYWSWLPFSLDVRYYQPRCEPCHLRLDKRYAKQRQGRHPTSPYEGFDADFFTAQAQTHQ